MSDHTPADYISAIADFHRARQQAVLEEIVARLTGAPVELLDYEEVRRKLKAQTVIERGLHDIPLDAIVGSVNRYKDFTRDFLPRANVGEERWARVEMATSTPEGVPPIDVYKIGQVYFVQDGNHRVSVARQLGATYIQAYVQEVLTPVPLTPDVTPEALILKSEYAGFLQRTRLPEIRPQANLELTVPGHYPVLEEHIAVHRYFMGLDLKRDIDYAEALAHWYDSVYLPVVQIIEQTGILRDFPGRTEADLYLWIAEHRAALEGELGREIRPEAAARDLAGQFSPRRAVSRAGEKLLGALIPKTLETGPSTGEWRKEKQAAANDPRLFSELLVPINGREDGWCALQQAIEIARREGGHLHGLHVVSSEADRESLQSQAVEREFDRRCAQAGISGKLAFAAGEVASHINDQARWNDLVVVNLTYPPASQSLAALSSGFRQLVQRCPRPLLAVPGVVAPLKRALLAYDGSPKAREALFIAAYMAGQWKLPLVVLVVLENGRVTADTLQEARQYLETHAIQAAYVSHDGSPITQILVTAEEYECDLLLMGGYAGSPVLNLVIGSTVDQALRESHKPILICR
jgi:nucleotide-binding universal stress UspA family protein